MKRATYISALLFCTLFTGKVFCQDKQNLQFVHALDSINRIFPEECSGDMFSFIKLPEANDSNTGVIRNDEYKLFKGLHLDSVLIMHTMDSLTTICKEYTPSVFFSVKGSGMDRPITDESYYKSMYNMLEDMHLDSLHIVKVPGADNWKYDAFIIFGKFINEKKDTDYFRYTENGMHIDRETIREMADWKVLIDSKL